MSYSTSTGASQAAYDVFGILKERAQLGMVYFGDLDRAVVKATNRDPVVPKAKHVQNIISGTWEQGVNLAEIFNALQTRLKEPWVVAMKSLILIHYMMRDGSSERVMGYLGSNPAILNMSSYRDSSSGGDCLEQSKNIKAYATYLEEKVACYRELKCDYIRADPKSSDRISKMTINDGLLREIATLQRLVKELLNCHFYTDSINNEVTTESLRLLIKDLLRLVQVLNEAVINMLREFFEAPRMDARKALELYKTFAEQTDKVQKYLETARHLQYGLGMTIPELKTTSLSLYESLKEYVDAPDFEAQRAAHIAKKKSGTADTTAAPPKPAKSGLVDVFASNVVAQQQQQSDQFFSALTAPSAQSAPASKVALSSPANPAVDPFDFFSSGPVPQSAPPVQQPNNFQPQPTSLFGYSQPQAALSQPLLPSQQNNRLALMQQPNSSYMTPQQQTMSMTPQQQAIPMPSQQFMQQQTAPLFGPSSGISTPVMQAMPAQMSAPPSMNQVKAPNDPFSGLGLTAPVVPRNQPVTLNQLPGAANMPANNGLRNSNYSSPMMQTQQQFGMSPQQPQMFSPQQQQQMGFGGMNNFQVQSNPSNQNFGIRPNASPFQQQQQQQPMNAFSGFPAQAQMPQQQQQPQQNPWGQASLI